MKSKRHIANLSKVDKTKLYTVEEAVKLAKELANTKFDSTLEVAMNLNLDVKKADQQLRGAVVLPNGTGKTKKILVLAKGDKAKEAKEASADYVGDVDMISKIEKENWFDFDVIIATPDMMPMLGKIGKILGPKGLMPNPKTGTVTLDVKRAIEDTKKGKVEYRTDTFGNIHAIVGKMSFDEDKLLGDPEDRAGRLRSLLVILTAQPSDLNFIERKVERHTLGCFALLLYPKIRQKSKNGKKKTQKGAEK